jgi:hypothetical protein
MSQLIEDVRFALRGLVRRPSTSLLLVSTLALGLAANGAIFNILDALVLRAFDFPNQSRLVRIHETSRDFDGIDLSNVAPANLIDRQAQSGTTFRDLVGLEWWDASLRGLESAERVQGYLVGPAFFDALGVCERARLEGREATHPLHRPPRLLLQGILHPPLLSARGAFDARVAGIRHEVSCQRLCRGSRY